MRKLPVQVQLLCLALLWVSGSCQGSDETLSSTAQSSASATADNTCLVCGEGGEIDNSSRMIVTPLGMFTCGGLEGAGIHGNIPSGQCSSAQTAALEKCGCILNDGTALNGEAEQGEQIFCSICPNEGVVTVPEGIVPLPQDDASKTCSEFLDDAVNGLLDQNQCDLLKNYTSEACGCTAAEEVEDLNRPDASNTTFVCPVCGEGMTSSTPNATVVVPGQSTVRTCAQFEKAAILGKISEQQCDMVMLFVEQSCSCQAGALVTPPPTRSPNSYDCQICGAGNIVTVPSGVVNIPTQVSRTCEELLHANAIGNINANQCSLLQPFVTTPCGCTPIGDTVKPTVTPTAAPSLSPTTPKQPTVSPAPTGWVAQKEGCFDTLADIYEIEKGLEDVSVRRRYILCGGTTFHLGQLSDDGRITNGDAFLMLRPNVMYQCGKNGSRQNNCILKGGDFGLASFYGVYEGIHETVENVRIQGLTFQAQTLFAAVMEAAGDIEFMDCAFKDQGNMVPVLIQWKGDGPTEPIELTRERQLRSSGGFIAARNLKLRVMTSPQNRDSDAIPAAMTDARKLQLKETSYNHTVTFRDCVFQGNHLTEKMGFPGIIENSFTSELSIINCIFMGNRYGEANNPAPFGYAIRSFGPINVESSCFVGNTFRAHAPIQVFGAPHSSIGNYVDSSQDDLTCDFLAVFSSQDDTAEVKPICFDSDARSCPMKLPPTKAPTSHPVDEQLNKPTSSSSSICRCTTSIVAILTTILLTLFRGFS